jgi:nucleotidyltransferase/DNA polymerase involved in DNA repair
MLFFSVEQLDNPDLIGDLLAVGGSENRGVVTAGC